MKAFIGLAAVVLCTALTAAAAKPAADTVPPTITHTAITTAPAGKPLTVTAEITDDSEIFEPTLYYRAADAQKFLSMSMLGTGSIYTATLPAAALDKDVEYFLEAYDAMGNGPARFASDTAPQRIAVQKAPVVAEVKPPVEKDPKQPVVDVVKPGEPEAAPGRTMKIAGWSLVGVGVASLAAGTYFGISSGSLRDEAVNEPSARLANDKLEDARSNATLANVTLIAGGVLAAGGAVLALLPMTSSSPSQPKDAETDTTFSVGPGGASLLVRF